MFPEMARGRSAHVHLFQPHFWDFHQSTKVLTRAQLEPENPLGRKNHALIESYRQLGVDLKKIQIFCCQISKHQRVHSTPLGIRDDNPHWRAYVTWALQPNSKTFSTFPSVHPSPKRCTKHFPVFIPFTHRFGILPDTRRLANVALTRAQLGLVVVANTQAERERLLGRGLSHEI